MGLFKKKDKRTPREKLLDYLNNKGDINEFFDFSGKYGRCKINIDELTISIHR